MRGAGEGGAAGGRLKRALRFLAGDLSGGLTGGIASASASIPIGLVACAPMGAALAGTATLSVFYGAICAGSVFNALRRTPGLQAGGAMPSALVVAGAMGSLVGQHVLIPGSSGGAALLATVMLLTVMTALCTAVLGMSGLGRLVPLIPFPVIAGIINAGAVLMVLAQFRQALGLQASSIGLWPHPGALAVSAVTLAVMVIPIVRIPCVPPPLLALLVGSAVHYALLRMTPPGFMGPVLGPIPSGQDHLHTIAAAWSALPSLPLPQVLGTLLPASLTMAVLATLDTLLGASTMQDVSGRHASAEPDLLALAAGNLCGGLIGTLPVHGGNNASMIVWSAGGRTKLAGFVRCGTILLIVAALPMLLAGLPLAVVAGLVIATAWRLADRESLLFARLALRPSVGRRGEIAANTVIVLVVVATALFYGMAAAVLAGGILSLALFATAMAQSVVRRQYARPIGRSRTSRPQRQTDILTARGAEIEIVELQGAIFFGSADQVARRIEAALGRGARHVILDLRHVTAIDFSGARRLVLVAERFWAAGVDLSVAHMRPGGPVATYLHTIGLYQRLRPSQVFHGLEEAVQHAERQVLAATGAESEPALTAVGGLRAIGLPPALAERFAAMLTQLEFPAGAKLIQVGERSTEFYVLLDGAVDVLVDVNSAAGETGRTRLGTLTAGLMVGEMAYLTGAQRSADVVARTDVSCLRVDAGVVDALRQTDPDIPFHLLQAIARQLERNLQTATVTLVMLEE